MWWIFILVIVILIGAAGLFVMYYISFMRNRNNLIDDRSLPSGEQYDPYNEDMLKAIERMLLVPYEEIRIRSFDGLKLYARYYQLTEEPNAPLVIFFHGYRCNSVRDGNGMFGYCQRCGYNILMVDQRAHGKSEGRTITFGVKERKDALEWAEYAAERFGSQVPMVLAGISMGAATVLMASNLDLPENVKGIIADCPYSAPEDILKTVMESMKLPAKIFYPLVRLSARIYGGFDPEESSAREAVAGSRVPILFIHGDDDRFVPCSMSQQCFDACCSEKKLVFVKDAGHGISYCVDAALYEKEVKAFLERVLG